MLGWPNRIDAATLSGGSWLSSLPLNNLKTMELAAVARSSNDATASTQFIADLGQARSLRAVALANHNLSAAATWKVSLGTTSGGSEVYAGSFQGAWSLSFAEGDIEWEADNWWGAGVGDEYQGHPFMAVYLFSTAGVSYDARYVKVEISDTSNSANYVQIGRCFIGGGFIPTINMSLGLQDSWAELSSAEYADNGAKFSTNRRRQRQTNLLLDHIPLSEGATLYEMVRRQGTVYDTLYVPDVADYTMTQRYGYLATMRQLSALEYPYVSRQSLAIALEEML